MQTYPSFVRNQVRVCTYTSEGVISMSVITESSNVAFNIDFQRDRDMVELDLLLIYGLRNNAALWKTL